MAWVESQFLRLCVDQLCWIIATLGALAGERQQCVLLGERQLIWSCARVLRDESPVHLSIEVVEGGAIILHAHRLGELGFDVRYLRC